MHKIQNPVAHVGIIGGGQLGRMMAMAARRMGCAVSVIDPAPDCPASQLADQQIVAAFDDQYAMRALVEACDVTTFEIETIDVTDLIQAEDADMQSTRLHDCWQNCRISWCKSRCLQGLGCPQQGLSMWQKSAEIHCGFWLSAGTKSEVRRL